VTGEFLTVFGASLQANELGIEKQKFEQWRMSIHLRPAQRQKPYVSAAFVPQCTGIVLIQFIDSPRINDEFTLKPVTLLMDDFSMPQR
jgi:hypothetical protein